MIRGTAGDARWTLLDGGSLWLDGGAMFGVVPKPLWRREREPDEKNRIELAMNLLLVETGDRRILVDTGAGTKWDEKSLSIYRIDFRSAERILEPVGLEPADIDTVLCSHLHFDHGGGNTRRAGDGALVPAFPEARYVMQKGELETARLQNERIRASYDPDNFEPLAAEPDRVRLIEGDVDLGGGLRVEVAPGHTPWMQIVLLGTGAETLCFLADLVPTASHVRYPYIMGYDLEPLRTLASKKRVLPRAVREGWTVVFEHDRRTPVARLVERDGRIAAEPRNGAD